MLGEKKLHFETLFSFSSYNSKELCLFITVIYNIANDYHIPYRDITSGLSFFNFFSFLICSFNISKNWCCNCNSKYTFHGIKIIIIVARATIYWILTMCLVFYVEYLLLGLTTAVGYKFYYHDNEYTEV